MNINIYTAQLANIVMLLIIVMLIINHMSAGNSISTTLLIIVMLIIDQVSANADHSTGAGEGSDFIDVSGGMPSGAGGNSGTAPQSVSWRAHQVDSWYEMCDATLQNM